MTYREYVETLREQARWFRSLDTCGYDDFAAEIDESADVVEKEHADELDTIIEVY